MSSIARFLVEKHMKLAKVLLPASVTAGFVYTMNTGRSALSDAEAALTGRAPEELAADWRMSTRWPTHWP